MKFLNKKMLTIVALLSVTGYSVGYTYEIANETDKTMVVRLVERRISISDGKGDQYATLQPREQKIIKLPGMWCLKTIQARSFNTLADVPKDMSTAAMLDIEMKMVSSKDNKTELGKEKGTADTMMDNKVEASKDNTASDLGTIKKAITTLTEESLCRDRKFTLTLTGKKAQKIIGDKTYNLPFDEIIATTSQMN